MNKKNLRPWYLDFISLLLGALLPLAFAPFNMYPIAILVPGALLLVWGSPNPKQLLWRGWLFGCGFFGIGVSWVYVSIHEHGFAPVWLASLITILFVAILALYFAGQAWLYRRLFPRPTLLAWCLGFPALWALFEWLRGWLFSGFPWLNLGYSQIDSPLGGYIPIVGIYGTSAITVAVGALLAYAFFTQARMRWISISAAILIVIAGFGLSYIQWTQPTGDSKQISLIQGNIPQAHKWDSKFVRSIIKKYVDLTEQNWDSSIIIWPEASLPIPLPDSATIVASLDQQARAHQATVIMGVLELAPGTTDYYNGIIATGTGTGLYHKRRLVPFGEYVPFGSVTRGIIELFNLPYSNIIPGNPEQPVLISGDWKISPLICYEIAYAQLADDAALQGNILLTISNDTWFGRSLGPKQHLQIAQFRALETGRYVIRATNNGLTAIINHRGEITAIAPAFETAVLTAQAQSTTGFTPIVRFGHWPIIIILLLLLGLAWYINHRKLK
ncbi:MAG: apolipoprotein N-acyltransferase [Gammaproteobacteria bacterium]